MSTLFPEILDDYLKILVVSDIHDNRKFYEALTPLLEKHPVDCSIVCGDILDLPHQINTSLAPLYDAQLVEYLTCFSSLTSNVLYVLGNHDPVLHSRLIHSENILRICTHKKRTLITPGLSIIGLNGSVPSYTDDALIYEGHPYADDNAFGKDLEESLSLALENEQVILLTHSGPKGETTLDRSGSKVIDMGSQSLSTVLDNNEQILINIHGHSHNSAGLVTHKQCSVLNPGSGVAGKGCFLELRRELGKWTIGNIDWFELVVD
ncbi:hypothetical protein P9112_009082 [Eukaryota sp. TZLM1-RC]